MNTKPFAAKALVLATVAALMPAASFAASDEKDLRKIVEELQNHFR